MSRGERYHPDLRAEVGDAPTAPLPPPSSRAGSSQAPSRAKAPGPRLHLKGPPSCPAIAPSDASPEDRETAPQEPPCKPSFNSLGIFLSRDWVETVVEPWPQPKAVAPYPARRCEAAALVFLEALLGRLTARANVDAWLNRVNAGSGTVGELYKVDEESVRSNGRSGSAR